ncbi:hypothetical protein DPMN_180648 [Dreissena polymorpha]|uniref:Uncharacterized protein n=1 Tax=Dreissena polymorpha TaxID=45954 RepID=A0A9D4EEJ8_DREPO|nr:hypothetical protein DPMN_180648 [Dreissena polymorpha]
MLSKLSFLRLACYCFFMAYDGEFLKLIAGATHEVNFIRESQGGDWSATDGDGGVLIFKGLLHYLLKENV